MSSKSVLQVYKSVKREVSSESVLQKSQVRVSSKECQLRSVLQECQVRVPQRKCHAGVSYKSVK